MSLTGFSGEPAEAKSIISKELMVGSKIVPIAFFVVNVRGRYNILLGCDWIHANGCVPSTLHQCVIQWVGDQVEVIDADDAACVAMSTSQEDVQGGRMGCFTGHDRSEYDYASVGKDGFAPISVKPMTSATQLIDDMV
jgi:hypothetical protein